MKHSTRVLIVDDDSPVLAATSMILRYAGFNVLTAASAEEALVIWRSNQGSIDVVVADLDLRNTITGQQLCELFRREDPSVQTILLTAHSLGPGFFGRIEGMNFFHKPFDAAALIGAVRDFLPELGTYHQGRTGLALKLAT